MNKRCMNARVAQTWLDCLEYFLFGVQLWEWRSILGKQKKVSSFWSVNRRSWLTLKIRTLEIDFITWFWPRRRLNQFNTRFLAFFWCGLERDDQHRAYLMRKYTCTENHSKTLDSSHICRLEVTLAARKEAISASEGLAKGVTNYCNQVFVSHLFNRDIVH